MNEFLDFAKALAVKAGDIMLEHFDFGIQVEWKSDATPVTVADKKVNSLVITEVNKYFPSHSVYGEEESDIKPDSEYLWVCDPIDGTFPYTLGIPCSTFSLALVKDGVPLVAVAYDPYMKRLISAQKGSGCYCNDQKISVNNKESLAAGRLTIIVESSNRNNFRGLEFRDMLARQYGARCPRLFSVVFSSMLVAAGTADAVLADLHTAHDIAAVKLFVEEAGGLVTDFYGNDQRYDGKIKGALITNAALHQEILALMPAYLD